MSQRHRTGEVTLPPKTELRNQAHRERQRIREELSDVTKKVAAGFDPADVHEPGAAWKPVHHHDPDVAKEKLSARRRRLRHWKTKMWKRRSLQRQAKARAFRVAGQ
ncbi:MAG: hypothetical protein ACK5OX_12290 [Desertimonas sp.]